MKTLSVSPASALVMRIVTLIVVCSAATLVLGKDSNWDMFNYHLYTAHAFWTNQDLQSDFMAAGLQRYFNPIGYLPFYWMTQAGWHSLLVGFVLAAFHSLSLVFLWEICSRFLFKDDSRPALLATVAVALAAMSPVFLGTLGGTFLDPVTLVFVFAGLLVLCFELERPRSTVLLPVLAGCLFGIAAGLKLTNGLYVASAGLAIVVASRFRMRGWTTGTWYGAGAAFGSIVAGGWWSVRLYREFGNPFFPLFNEYFHSPDFSEVKLLLVRFKPASLLDALSFPFDMTSSHMWVYIENVAADIRLALLIVFALTLLAFQLFRLVRHRHTKPKEAQVRSVSVAMIVLFFLVSFPIWVWTSGNGRYGEPILLLVGPVLVFTVRAAFPNRKWFAGLMLAILSAQGIVIAIAENPRWDAGDWSANWIDVDAPSKLKDSPHGYLSEGVNSNAFIALYVHPDSRFVNLIGAFPLSLDGPGGRRVGEFISTHAGKLRTMGKLEIPFDRAVTGTTRLSDYLDEIDGRYALWDLRVDPTDCVPFKFSVRSTNYAMLISCALLPGNPRRLGMLPAWERASRVFDRVEKACPVLFNPPGGFTTKRGEAWHRLYLNTEARLRAFNGHVLYSRDPLGPFGVDLGTLEDWEAGVSKWICTAPQPHWKSAATK